VTPQSGNQVSTSLGNSGLCWTVFARNRDTAVPAEGNGDLQTLICVLVARLRRCLTLSNPVPWQNWMVAYLSYTLLMRTLFRGWPIMVNDTHTRRRRLTVFKLHHWILVISLEMTCNTSPISVRLCGVNVFKTISVQDCLSDVVDTWHIYSMDSGTKRLGSGILNVALCNTGRPGISPLVCCWVPSG